MTTCAIHIDGKEVLAKRSTGMHAQNEELPAELFSFPCQEGPVIAHKDNKAVYYVQKSKGTKAMVVSRVTIIIDKDKKDSTGHILRVKTTAGSPFRTEWTSLFASDWNFRNATGDKAEDADIKTSIASEKAAATQKCRSHDN